MFVQEVDADVQGMEMQMLYDSDDFVVVRTALDGPPGIELCIYEIARKADCTVAVLRDGAAVAFTEQVLRWKTHVPRREEVEAALDSYSQLSAMPICAH